MMQSRWKQSALSIITVPTDLGIDTLTFGVADAPAYLLEGSQGLADRLSHLGWSVCEVCPVQVPSRNAASDDMHPSKHEVYLVCSELADAVDYSLNGGALPLVLGGDHSLTIGSAAGVVRHFARRGERIGVIWLDAHPDMNTPATSPTQNIHGMPMACCVALATQDAGSIEVLGELANLVFPKIAGANVCMIGVRDIDVGKQGRRGEDDVMKGAGVVTIPVSLATTPVEAGAIMRAAIEIATRGTAGFHLSFDIDFLDPQFAPAAGTPCENGATVEATRAVLEAARDSGKLLSLDLVEIHPGQGGAERTRLLALEFLSHLLRR